MSHSYFESKEYKTDIESFKYKRDIKKLIELIHDRSMRDTFRQICKNIDTKTNNQIFQSIYICLLDLDDIDDGKNLDHVTDKKYNLDKFHNDLLFTYKNNISYKVISDLVS